MLTRKRLLAVAGGAGAAGVLAACGGKADDGADADQRREDKAGDLAIIRFFQEVEAVEHAFWSQVVERGALGEVGAGALAEQFARNEAEHAGTLERFARGLGGQQAPAAPATRFEDIFAAGPQEVLATGATLENLAAAAYLGQVNRVQDRNILASVLAIHTVEGRQAAALNRRAGRGFTLGSGQLEGALPDGPFAEPMDMQKVRRRLQQYSEGG
jgi:hypothetical protein